jgi:PTS system nitrogen regulatory IIA component
MKLSTYLDDKFIFFDIKGDNKDEVIMNIINKVSEVDRNINECKVNMLEATIKREHEISTCIGNGIFIPHARVEDYDDITVIFATLEKPIKSEIAALHKEDLVDKVFMIVAGKTKNKIILKLMASVSRLAQNQEFLEKIKGKQKHDIIKLIKQYEKEIKDNITAEDVMNTELQPASVHDTLEEIAKRFIVDGMTGLPVVDDFGNFVGEITERELIEYGMPKYTSLLSDLSFMTVGEPFEEYFKDEKTVTVEELYRKNPTTLDRKASIMEISFIMVTKGKTRIYIVENQKYYGTILRSDIIRKVLHI